MAEMSQAEEASTQATEVSPEADVIKLPVYEVGFHVVPTVAEADVAAVVDKIRKALGNAEIIAEGFPARMQLAYTIERSTQGKRDKYNESYFGWIKFAAPREEAVELAGVLRGTPEVLRQLIIETLREDIVARPTRAVFTSDRLEGQTLKRPTAAPEKGGEVSEEELNKSIEALVAE